MTSPKSKRKPKHDLDALIRETERGNFVHVNDVAPLQVISFDFCNDICFYLVEYKKLEQKLARIIPKEGVQMLIDYIENIGCICWDKEDLCDMCTLLEKFEKKYKWKSE